MPELSTLGNVVKPTYESENDTNAFTDSEKAKLLGVAEEATANASDADLRDRSTHTGTQAAATISDLPDLLSAKVDAAPGKVLSDTSFTQAEKDKLSALEDSHFKGGHIGLAGLEAAHPTAVAGDFAFVDDGANLVVYRWNALADPAAWELSPGESAEVTPAQVKTYYEQNPDTNAFTDSEKAQLAAIQAEHVSTVNGQSGAVEVTPDNIGALPDTYQPDWADVQNKPSIGGGRTQLYAQSFDQENTEQYIVVEFDYTQFSALEVDVMDIQPTLSAYLYFEVRIGGVWQTSGYRSAVHGSAGGSTYSVLTNQARALISAQVDTSGTWAGHYRIPTDARKGGDGYGFSTSDTSLSRPYQTMFRPPQGAGDIEAVRLFWSNASNASRSNRNGRIEVYGVS